MNTSLNCITCFVNQAQQAIQLASDDPGQREAAFRAVLRLLSEAELSLSPPAIARQIHRAIRTLCDNPDPYRQIKQQSNEGVLQLLPRLRRALADLPDPFEGAVHLAIAGNIIDYGIHHSLTEADINRVLNAALHTPLCGATTGQFRQAVERAGTILYLADNCGEIILDLLLLEQLPPGKTTVAVRHSPILNDATLADARLAGLDRLAPLITNGSDGPGSVLDSCSAEFLDHFHNAGLIISKGQGNFETLDQTRRPIYFLFKVKCAEVARFTGYPLDSALLLPHGLD